MCEIQVECIPTNKLYTHTTTNCIKTITKLKVINFLDLGTTNAVIILTDFIN